MDSMSVSFLFKIFLPQSSSYAFDLVSEFTIQGRLCQEKCTLPAFNKLSKFGGHPGLVKV